jgi:Family of unknown function (DUF6308)
MDQEFAACIRALTERPDGPRRIEEYLDPTSNHAAYSFDTAGANPPLLLTSDDLLALNFLGAPIGPMAYRRLMELQPDIARGLRKLNPDLHLWHMVEESQAYRDALALWELLVEVADLDQARVSMVMARKRPKLVPVWDARVSDFYGRRDPSWVGLGTALRDADLRSAVETMRPSGMDTSALSLLRVLDIAIRMA